MWAEDDARTLSLGFSTEEPPNVPMLRPNSLVELCRLLAASPPPRLLAGGLELLPELASGATAAEAVVSLDRVAELGTVEESGDQLLIGAGLTLEAVSRHPTIRDQAPLLAITAGAVGTPQVRHQATVGGNLLQGPRCLAYRRGLPCVRRGDQRCAVSDHAPDARHDLVDRSISPGRCLATNGSDLAAALVALDAQVSWVSARGSIVTADAAAFLTTARGELVAPGDRIVTAVHVSRRRWNVVDYQKHRPANASPLATVGIAAAIDLVDGTVHDLRLAASGIADVPVRLTRVEACWRGRDVEDLAGSDLERVLPPGLASLPVKAGTLVRLLHGVRSRIAGPQ